MSFLKFKPARKSGQQSCDDEDPDPVVRILQQRNFFDRLGLPRDRIAGAAAVRQQYRRLALICHPDKSQHPRANAAFQALSEAFECLYDSEQQAAYVQSQMSGFRKSSGRSKRKATHNNASDFDSGSRSRSWAAFERDLKQREMTERRLRARFVRGQSARFADRATEQLLTRAQKACRTLDERTGKYSNWLWKPLVVNELVQDAQRRLPEGWAVRHSSAGDIVYYSYAENRSQKEHPNQAIQAKLDEVIKGSDPTSAEHSSDLSTMEQLRAVLDYLRDIHVWTDLEDDYAELSGAVADRQPPTAKEYDY